MSKYPKSWLEAAEIKFYGGKHYREAHFDDYSSPSDILDSLNEVGALKEIPQSQHYYICTACLGAFSMDYKGHACHHPSPHLIKVQEVEDE